MLFEIFRHARDGSTGADRAHKCIDRSLGLRPDLGAGRLVVGESLGSIIELVYLYRIPLRLGIAISLLLVVHLVTVRHRRYNPYLGPQGLKNPDLFC